MKNSFLLLLLILGLPTFAQTTLYQAFEVDSAAEPRGGITFLNTFLQANLRKPVLAEAKGIGGTVIVTGVVETDGHVSDIVVIKSLRPDCDREAVRVFGLFGAWKPAQKDGKAVRQKVNLPILYKLNKPFTYIDGAKVSYFDANNKPIADSSQAQYRQLAPMDSSGLPTGDIVLYKRKELGWKKDFRLPLVRKVDKSPNSSGQSVQLIGYQNSNQQWEGQLFSLSKAGVRIRQAFYQSGKRVGPEINYHSNGSVAQKADDFEDKVINTYWYPNGQIKQISEETKLKYSTLDSTGQVVKLNSPVQVMEFWTIDGQQLVKKGNGSFIDQRKSASYSDTTRQTQVTEKGRYKDGFKQGTWTVQYADNSYYYEDEYNDGFFRSGKACVAGTDTTHYTVLDMMPEFQGGLNGLQQFLRQNLRYPVNAQRAGVQGQVFVSFVVCADGALCDYEVLKGVQSDLDKEAIRVVKLMSGRWNPCIQRGQKIRLKYNMPINFSLY